MKANPERATLPQLLDRYRAMTTASQGGQLNDLVRLSHQSIALEGTPLTLAQTRHLLLSAQRLTGQPLPDQWRMIDHHNALQLVLTKAEQHEPLNRTILQEIAATLMAQTGGPVYSLLSQVDTRTGALRLDSAGIGQRTLVSAHQLPTTLDALLKEINTRISRLKTPRQVYDLSFDAHFRLLTLHPFGAGNGPMARLLMTYVQHYHHLPLSTIDPGHRMDYQRALAASWQGQTVAPVVGFLHRELWQLLEEGS